MTELPNGQVCSAIVLAAGEGARLRSWLEQQLGETLQKQYAKLLGPRSMLECTLDRVEKLIPRERIFTVVGRRHLGYPVVRAQLTSRAERTVISQPMNRDTGVGILLPLMHIVKRYPESLIAIFPSDHFIAEEDRFLTYVFCPSSPSIGTPAEAEVTEVLYKKLPPFNFSRGLLEALPPARPGALFVLPVPGFFWSDWGMPRNVQRALLKTGQELPHRGLEQGPTPRMARQPIASWPMEKNLQHRQITSCPEAG